MPNGHAQAAAAQTPAGGGRATSVALDAAGRSADHAREGAPAYATHPRPRGRTERHFLLAMLATASIVAVFWVAYAVERNVLDRHPRDLRYIGEASEAAMRYITIPHIVIGFLFLVSSPKNRTRDKRIWTAGLLALGAILCFVYYAGGAKANLFLYSSVYLYFLVHELRDEAMFYSVLGEAAPVPDKAVFGRFVRALVALIVVSIGLVMWAPAPFGVFHDKLTGPTSAIAGFAAENAVWFDGSMAWPARLAVALAPLLVVAAGWVLVLRRYAAALGYPDVRTLYCTHAPMFRVMFGVAAVLGLAILLTQRPYSLITFHVVAWYIFAVYQFRRFPPKTPPRSRWLWMRTSVKGFKTLHIGMVAVLMLIGLVWTLFLPESAPVLAWLLAPESFLYWTIMHITVSFGPR